MSYKKFEEYNIEVTEGIKNDFTSIINSLGEDTTREGILKTPERAAKAMPRTLVSSLGFQCERFTVGIAL